MTKRIKWIEDKSNDFRGNHEQFCFKLDNSPMIFSWCAIMTYKSFKNLCKRFAQHYGASSVTIISFSEETHQEYIDNHNRMSVLDRSTLDYENNQWTNEFKFRKELIVPEGSLRQFQYYSENDIFPEINKED